jgi:hypothetical protein
MAIRVGLGLVAAAAVAWLAVLLHGVALREDGQKIALRDPRSLSGAEVTRAVSLLRRAEAHTPDTEPILDQAALLVRVGQVRRSRPLLEDIVRREPENVQAWAVLALATQTTDPGRAAVARARVTVLAPLVPPPPNG